VYPVCNAANEYLLQDPAYFIGNDSLLCSKMMIGIPNISKFVEYL
jgi:hypothetical protein